MCAFSEKEGGETHRYRRLDNVILSSESGAKNVRRVGVHCAEARRERGGGGGGLGGQCDSRVGRGKEMLELMRRASECSKEISKLLVRGVAGGRVMCFASARSPSVCVHCEGGFGDGMCLWRCLSTRWGLYEGSEFATKGVQGGGASN